MIATAIAVRSAPELVLVILTPLGFMGNVQGLHRKRHSREGKDGVSRCKQADTSWNLACGNKNVYFLRRETI